MSGKRIAIATVVAASLLLSACANSRTICGVTYKPYGIANADDVKNPDVEYDLVVGNLVWTVLLFETIIAPIYFLGWALFEPVGVKPKVKGAVADNACPAPETKS